MNTEKLHYAIEQYKETFPKRWKDEEYKWIAVKRFQDCWDIKTDDFETMFTAATDKTDNLLASRNNFPRQMIQQYAKQDPEAVRAMFIHLYDETIDVAERILQFMSDADALCEQYSPGKQHYQRPMPITVYLWLKYPEKYDIFKYTVCKKTCEYLDYDFVPKKGNTAANIKGNLALTNEILRYAMEDQDLLTMEANALNSNCYSDSEHRILAFDISFYIANFLVEEEAVSINSQANEESTLSSNTVETEEFSDYESLKSNARFKKWMNPIIVTLRELGGSASVSDVNAKLIEMFEISEEDLAEMNSSGTSKVLNDIAWARNYLNYEGFLDSNAPRGIWSLSALGESIIISDQLAGMITGKWIRITAAKRENKTIPVIDLAPYYEYLKQETFVFPAYSEKDFLDEVYMTSEKYETLKAVLLNKKNIILKGAPGVGKTFAAKRLAYSILGCKDEDKIEFIQFHQNYSYEDFIMGYRPSGDGFELKTGVFYNFCQKAANHPDSAYFFIIDEINRGNMSKIFGELLMLIEKDYRGTTATLAYDGSKFTVPENVYMIGMMNTADRSLALIDYALRRRFSFFTMEPGFLSDGFEAYRKSFENDTFNLLISNIQDLNKEISRDHSLGEGFCIGHSYFCGQSECTDEWMQTVVEYDILPMLEEYWFDEPSKLQKWQNILRGVFND